MYYIYVLYMNAQHLWTALFSFSLHISPSIPKADARLGFPVFSVSRAEPWPQLMIRCTTGMRPGFRRTSVEKEVISAMCFLVSVASTADGQTHRGLGHTAERLCSVVEGSLFCALQWYIKMQLWACFSGFSGNSTNYLILFSNSASNSQNIFTLVA